MNNQEVEITAKVDTKRASTIEKKLLHLGAEKIGEFRISDVYLCPNATQSFKEIEMSQIGSYSLRIRQKDDGNKQDILINTKQLTQDNDHRSWKEHEMNASSFDEALRIFNTIGFKVFCKIDKKRISYAFDRFTICIEEIFGFAHIIEVEVMTTHEDSANTKKDIENFMKRIGLHSSDHYEKSATNSYMKSNSSF